MSTAQFAQNRNHTLSPSRRHAGGASGKSPIELAVRFLKDGGGMIVILRDLKTGLYFGPEKVWVAKPQEAADFLTLEAAGRGAWECGSQHVAVVLRYNEPECELALNPALCMTTTPAVQTT